MVSIEDKYWGFPQFAIQKGRLTKLSMFVFHSYNFSPGRETQPGPTIHTKWPKWEYKGRRSAFPGYLDQPSMAIAFPISIITPSSVASTRLTEPPTQSPPNDLALPKLI